MRKLDKKQRQKEYCAELVYSTQLGRQRYLDFMRKSSTTLNMQSTQNQLRVPPLQNNIKRGGYMYRKRLCPTNNNY